MGANTIIRIGGPQPANEERPDLPYLGKCIKSMKDRCYAVVRYAYLKEWKYYVLETKEFKIAVRAQKNPEFFSYLTRHFSREEEIWICVEGLDYYPIYGPTKLAWANSESERSIQCWIEGEPQDRPLPDEEEINDELAF